MRYLICLLLSCLLLGACTQETRESAQALNMYEQKMVGKKWVTTAAVDQNGRKVPAKDQKVTAFFGYAEYFKDHTFVMTTLDGKPKMHGLWKISEDGKSRTLTAQDDNGKNLFFRTVENVTLSSGEYTYRVYPDEKNKKDYIDIIHKPR